MGKKKRIRKLTVFGCVEGDREHFFLDYLREVYQPEANNIAFYPEHSSGGTPDRIVNSALHKCDRDKSFAWFDEDFEPAHPLGNETRESLAKSWNISDERKETFLACPLKDLQSAYNINNRKPSLIISQPVCSESLILKILGESLPYEQYEHEKRDSQIKGLKNKLDTLMAGKADVEFYKEVLSKEKLEKIRENIPELDLLIKMITK